MDMFHDKCKIGLRVTHYVIINYLTSFIVLKRFMAIDKTLTLAKSFIDSPHCVTLFTLNTQKCLSSNPVENANEFNLMFF